MINVSDFTEVTYKFILLEVNINIKHKEPPLLLLSREKSKTNFLKIKT